MTQKKITLAQIDAVFLDRDGTLVVDKHYLCHKEDLELLPGVGATLAAFNKADCSLFVVTNQSGIGRGYFSMEQYERCASHLTTLLKAEGATLTATRCCPHAPVETAPLCQCRKPNTGMWQNLRAQYALQPERCLMVGDKIADLLFGLKAGFAASVLVLTGHGEEEAALLGVSLPENQSLIPITLPEGCLPAEEERPDTQLFLARDLPALYAYLTE